MRTLLTCEKRITRIETVGIDIDLLVNVGRVLNVYTIVQSDYTNQNHYQRLCFSGMFKYILFLTLISSNYLGTKILHW